MKLVLNSTAEESILRAAKRRQRVANAEGTERGNLVGKANGEEEEKQIVVAAIAAGSAKTLRIPISLFYSSRYESVPSPLA